MAVRVGGPLLDRASCRHNIYVVYVYIQYKHFAHHLCGRNVRKGLLESSRMSGLGSARGVRGAGDIQLQSVSFPKRAGGWPLGLANAKNMFNLT